MQFFYKFTITFIDSLTFERNNLGTKADVMSLTRDGYVGIGTNNPSQKLHVIGAGFIDNTGTTGGLTVEASSNANITLQNAQNTAYSATLSASAVVMCRLQYTASPVSSRRS